MSVAVKSRSQLGFRGDPYGYVFFINGTPCLQLHTVYSDYIRTHYTLFWLGRADIQGLRVCLQETVEELAEQFGYHAVGHHRSSLSNVTALYGRTKGTVSMPFNIYYDPSRRKESLRHDNFITTNIPVLTFARYDVEYDKPIILWGDLKRSQQPEVGFTSVRIPSSVMQYFRHTCVQQISDEDFKSVKEELRQLTPPIH